MSDTREARALIHRALNPDVGLTDQGTAATAAIARAVLALVEEQQIANALARAALATDGARRHLLDAIDERMQEGLL